MAAYYQEGNYTATIVSHTFEPGQYGVHLVFEIEPHVESGETYKRRVYLPFLDSDGNPDKNSEKTIEVLQSIGYNDVPSRLDRQSANPASLIGTEVSAYCKHKEGRERWYVNTPREEREREAVNKSTLRKLDALFGKQLKKAGKPPMQQPTKQPADVNAELSAAVNDETVGDDIPF